MKKIKIDFCDLCFVFFAICFFVILILGAIPEYYRDKVAFEQECVAYYKENDGYILERCEAFKDKMLSIEVLE